MELLLIILLFWLAMSLRESTINSLKKKQDRINYLKFQSEPKTVHSDYPQLGSEYELSPETLAHFSSLKN